MVKHQIKEVKIDGCDACKEMDDFKLFTKSIIEKVSEFQNSVDLEVEFIVNVKHKHNHTEDKAFKPKKKRKI